MCDDGHNDGSGYHLYPMAFSHREAHWLKKLITKRLGLKCKVTSDSNNKPIIRFPASEHAQIARQLRRFAVPGMAYKAQHVEGKGHSKSDETKAKLRASQLRRNTPEGIATLRRLKSSILAALRSLEEGCRCCDLRDILSMKRGLFADPRHGGRNVYAQIRGVLKTLARNRQVRQRHDMGHTIYTIY
jgi:hypothetical protein